MSAVKLNFATRIDADLYERVRNTVYWTPGLSVRELTENALVAAVAELEKSHGGPFSPREKSLSGAE